MTSSEQNCVSGNRPERTDSESPVMLVPGAPKMGVDTIQPPLEAPEQTPILPQRPGLEAHLRKHGQGPPQAVEIGLVHVANQCGRQRIVCQTHSPALHQTQTLKVIDDAAAIRKPRRVPRCERPLLMLKPMHVIRKPARPVI